MNQLPDEPTLKAYLGLLREVLLQARLRAGGTDAQIADLLDAVENVPDLLLRWPDMNESILMADLRRIEARYPEWNGCFSARLREGLRN